MITALKALHIVALIVWCAGLIALPLMVAKHDPQRSQAAYSRLRRLTHYSYAYVVTPAAVVAIAAGTTLVFVRAVFEPWMFAKLLAVGLLVGMHAWQGAAVVAVGESPHEERPMRTALMVGLSLAVMTVVLVLVLAKPDFPSASLPEWLLEPRERQLPFDETPIR